MATIEEWQPARGYEGMYQVSNHGRVRSLPGNRRHGKVLSPMPRHRGHLVVSLYRDSKLNPQFIHTLVLEAFVCPRPLGQVCRHLNGKPEDNRVENLKWGTPLENGRDMVAHDRCWQSKKTHCPAGHEYSPENTYQHKDRHGHVRRNCDICRKDRMSKFKQRRAIRRAMTWGNTSV